MTSFFEKGRNLPIGMFKILLVVYSDGIKSERRLVEEIQLNIAYDGSAALNRGIPFRTTQRSEGKTAYVSLIF